MSFRPQDLDAYNDDVTSWTKEAHDKWIAAMDAQGIVHRSYSKSPVPARKAVKAITRKNAGMINRISFRMPRHLVFVHKGVGNGTPIDMVGKTGRKAKPHLNPVIDENLDGLATIVADHQGQMVLNALIIK